MSHTLRKYAANARIRLLLQTATVPPQCSTYERRELTQSHVPMATTDIVETKTR
jgi:hypothetical protein